MPTRKEIIKRAGYAQQNGCHNTACQDCILHNVICNVDYLGDTPAEDSKILITGFFIGMKFMDDK